MVVKQGQVINVYYRYNNECINNNRKNNHISNSRNKEAKYKQQPQLFMTKQSIIMLDIDIDKNLQSIDRSLLWYQK